MMPLWLIAGNEKRRGSVGTSFDPATAAWSAAVNTNGGSVTPQQKLIVDALITGIKHDGVWTKLDRLWLLAAENAPSALTDVKALALATIVSAPTFATLRGYTGADALNGTIPYIDTGFNPTSGTPNFGQNAGHVGVWSNTAANDSNGGVAIGSCATINGGSGSTSVWPFLTSVTFFSINSAGQSNDGGAGGTGQGFFVSNRSNSSDVTLYRNGSSLSDQPANTSGAPFNGNFFVLAWNNAGTVGLGTAKQICAATIGGALSAADETNFYNRMRTYMTAVGVP